MSDIWGALTNADWDVWLKPAFTIGIIVVGWTVLLLSWQLVQDLLVKWVKSATQNTMGTTTWQRFIRGDTGGLIHVAKVATGCGAICLQAVPFRSGSERGGGAS